jgi:hypothetical protein
MTDSWSLVKGPRHEAWWSVPLTAVGLQTAPGASHSLRMSEVQQEVSAIGNLSNRINCQLTSAESPVILTWSKRAMRPKFDQSTGTASRQQRCVDHDSRPMHRDSVATSPMDESIGPSTAAERACREGVPAIVRRRPRRSHTVAAWRGSSSMAPVTLTPNATGFNNPIGIDYHEPTDQVILSVNWPTDRQVYAT